jgi:hypothetical protein
MQEVVWHGFEKLAVVFGWDSEKSTVSEGACKRAPWTESCSREQAQLFALLLAWDFLALTKPPTHDTV